MKLPRIKLPFTRERRRDMLVAALCFALVAGWFYFRDRTQNLVECMIRYQEVQSETSQVRSGLVERESDATRNVITGARDVKSRREFNDLFDTYEERLRRIDRGRDRHPVPGFSVETCTA